jgi:glycosyltransferase involved in cell wall biosynthesis
MPINTEEMERIKKEFSDDIEYFLYNGSFLKSEELIVLLKSFSHFKIRQQSSFKLLLLLRSNPAFEKNISDYKYRADVKFIGSDDKNEMAMITAAAYAVILLFNGSENVTAGLNAMKTGVPVIASKDSAINEVAGEAALYAETGAIKDIGEKMMQVYTDENYRSLLIEKGIAVVNKFNSKKAVDSLRQAILKALE